MSVTGSTTVTEGRATAVRIRRAGAADAALVRTMLLELATHEGTADAVGATVDDWSRMLADTAVVVLIAYAGDRPVGYVSGTRQLNLWIGREIFALDDLYVRPEARNSGIGGSLMAALARQVADERPLITWGVREDNDAGHRFYRRLGARLRTKVVASWQPDAYRAHAASAPEVEPATGVRRSSPS
ncbi:MAG TPA: GNAT family N-acetyltransferase [Nocardioides sp.]|nr:GNAT family N-acetyltransferase [Nocardioides sp.]